MRILYNIAFLIFGIFYIPCLFFRQRMHGGFKERFGIFPAGTRKMKGAVWIHGVSVGEAAIAVKLAARIKKYLPGKKTIISTTTRTGNELVRSQGKGAVDAVIYSPLDLSFTVSRVARTLEPSAYIMVETELWPNILTHFHSKNIPVMLVNGRISDRSFKNYCRAGWIMRRVLSNIDVFCMQSDKDAERVKRIGADEKNVFVTGNMKFDGSLSAKKGSEAYSKTMLGFSERDRVIVAGSTHFSEEETLINIYRELKTRYSDLKLVLAPRHVERADAIEVYCAKSGLAHRRFSGIISGGGAAGPCDVVLVDTIGHLADLYEVATVIFVGGSLIKKGGQNPIEGARFGKPVVFGPYMFNFRETARVFLESGAAREVKDGKGLGRVLDELISDETKRSIMAENAREVVMKNQGTIDAAMRYILPILGRE